MDIQNILADLKKERENLDRAIGALEGLGTAPSGKTGRQPSGRSYSQTQTPPHERCLSQTHF